ncbi:MAG: hypothetical protein Q9157_002530 [Trypethelium eluteriae]
MLRSNTFNPDRQPLRHNTTFTLYQDHTRGPVPFLNPTRARYEQYYNAAGLPIAKEEAPEAPPAADTESRREKTKPALTYQWTSRDNRKGRHRLIVPSASDSKATESIPGIDAPKPSNSLQSVSHGLWLMCTYYPVWDISFDVAYIFTWGSIVWVINAFFSFLPLAQPSTEFPGEIQIGGGITAFIGATIFEIGSVLLLIEAVNAGREGCFGWAVENAWYGGNKSSSTSEENQMREQQPETNAAPADSQRNGDSQPAPSEKSKTTGASKSTTLSIRPDKSRCIHHHPNKRNLVGKPPASAIATQDFPNPIGSTDTTLTSSTSRNWTWFPTLSDLRTHYLHELGFLASLVQFFAATIFWIAGFTALPHINSALSPGALDGIYWTPQVLGGVGFIVSGFLFMLETQPNWYTPALGTLGWHIGLWNLIGGVGFTLCPAFGYCTKSWCVYQASLSTFWGSWAFLVGSAVQWYESLQKYPVEVEKGGKKVVDS